MDELDKLPRSLVDEIWDQAGMNRPQLERESEARERALGQLPPESAARVREIQDLRALVAEGPGEMEPPPQGLLAQLQDPFIESLAARDELREALAVSGDERARKFLEDSADPKWAKWSFSALARKNKLNPSAIVDIFRSYKLTQGMVEQFRSAPEMSKKLASDARERWVQCPSCSGHGEIQGRREDLEDPESRRTWRVCKECSGEGFVDRPSEDAREKVLEILQWTGKARGPQVQVNVGTPKQSMESILGEIEDLERQGSRTEVIDIDANA